MKLISANQSPKPDLQTIWQELFGNHPDVNSPEFAHCYLPEIREIADKLQNRSKSGHKGTFGHALIIAGKKGMAGACVLSSKAALKSGAGLVTAFGPDCNRTIVQTAVPEVIFISDENQEKISRMPDLSAYDSIVAGPGIGTHHTTMNALDELLQTIKVPLVLDADALNIISLEKALLSMIPSNSILTPHPGEFDRLFGISNSAYERLLVARTKAMELQVYIVLKGAYTRIITPDGQVFFNSTGNAGMATAGSGDVLSGIIAALLAQKYSPLDAALIGVYLHGLSGDLSLSHETMETLTASDLIENLKGAFSILHVYKNDSK